MTGMIVGVLKGDHIIMQQYKYLVHIFISFFQFLVYYEWSAWAGAVTTISVMPQ